VGLYPVECVDIMNKTHYLYGEEQANWKSMKIAVFNTKDYDIKFLTDAMDRRAMN